MTVHVDCKVCDDDDVNCEGRGEVEDINDDDEDGDNEKKEP